MRPESEHDLSRPEGNGIYLTPREEEILRLSARGFRTIEIGKKLHLSPHTVKGHTANIRERLGTHSGLETILTAVELNLISNDFIEEFQFTKYFTLSPTEREIVDALASPALREETGYEISKVLAKNPHTLHNQMNSIRGKLNTGSTTQVSLFSIFLPPEVREMGHLLEGRKIKNNPV